MPESEHTVFESWRSNINRVNQEELIEILDNHSCRRITTSSTASEIIQELAHKMLVQEPAYVIEQKKNKKKENTTKIHSTSWVRLAHF